MRVRKLHFCVNCPAFILDLTSVLIYQLPFNHYAEMQGDVTSFLIAQGSSILLFRVFCFYAAVKLDTLAPNPSPVTQNTST